MSRAPAKAPDMSRGGPRGSGPPWLDGDGLTRKCESSAHAAPLTADATAESTRPPSLPVDALTRGHAHDSCQAKDRDRPLTPSRGPR